MKMLLGRNDLGNQEFCIRQHLARCLVWVWLHSAQVICRKMKGAYSAAVLLCLPANGRLEALVELPVRHRSVLYNGPKRCFAGIMASSFWLWCLKITWGIFVGASLQVYRRAQQTLAGLARHKVMETSSISGWISSPAFYILIFWFVLVGCGMFMW